MIKVAIIIDAWKLPIFKRTLDSEGYRYEQFNGLFPGCISLKIETDNVDKLHSVVRRIQAEAARSKMN